MSTTQQYRDLEEGELIQHGDEFKSPKGEWSQALSRVQFTRSKFHPHRRPLPAPVKPREWWLVPDDDRCSGFGVYSVLQLDAKMEPIRGQIHVTEIVTNPAPAAETITGPSGTVTDGGSADETITETSIAQSYLDEAVELIRDFKMDALRNAELFLERVAPEPVIEPDENGWLPIHTFNLPDKKSCLVYCDNRHNTYAAYFEAGIWFHFAAGLGRLTESPSHWQPVPKPPIQSTP